MQKIRLILILCLLALSVTGCGQVFIDKDKMYEIVRYDSGDLENNVYYIKDGSAFYQTYLPEVQDGIYKIHRDVSLIPDLYRNECIAYKTTNLSVRALELTRYSDEGVTVGIYGLKNNSEGKFEFNGDKNTYDKSNASDVCRRLPSPNIKVESINGKNCNTYELSDKGTIRGLNEGDVLNFEIYSGSVYGDVSITADTHMLVPFETISSIPAESTKVGYLSLRMPENAKSGYYLIKGVGFFRYHDHEKGNCAEGGDYLNEPSRNSIHEELLERYEQYTVIVSAKTYDVEFNVNYDTSTATDTVTCIMESPLGEIYYMDVEDGNASLSMAEVIAGRWTMNIYPKGVSVGDVSVHSARPDFDSMCEEYMFETDHIIPSARFIAYTSGKGDVWGTVENMETGEAYVLKKSDGNKYICNVPYLPVGQYRMRVYHYVDTSITDGKLYEIDDKFENEEIIVIDEQDGTETEVIPVEDDGTEITVEEER